ncbi:MAG: LysR family transcriptional regulator [Rhodospirillales bacterium]|nr:LysR family transcriptional regulator [Rhodospirillales bacterium]
MARKFYNLPPLTALATFEAAARHGSFKRAAQELNVTPSAISHQIKALEQELGLPLFQRSVGGMLPTLEGRQLQAVLERGFTEISQVLGHLRRTQEPASVTVSATTAVASLWLMPRVSRFWRSHPSLRINQHASDEEPLPSDPQADLRIRYGDGDWPGQEAALLFRDRIAPLCTLAYRDLPDDRDLEALAAGPLIHIENSVEGWTAWPAWFRAFGYQGPIDKTFVMNNHVIALQAAQDGAGICLGWLALAAPLLEQRLLRPLGERWLPSPGDYYLTWRADKPLSKEAGTFRDWLLTDAADAGEKT